MTRKFKFRLLMSALLMGYSALSTAIEYKTNAICDKTVGFCADWMGVSVALTEMYLGKDAEKKLMAIINKVGIENFDASEFTMSGGLTCHTKEKMCWTSRLREQQDKKAMKVLFGD